MTQPDILAKVHSPEIAAKRGKRKAAWFRAGSPKALKELQRIRELNPMANPESRLKASLALKQMGHKPSVRGGNGHGLTTAQAHLLAILGQGWIAEYVLSLGKRTPGYPTHYKLDLANPELKVCIEVDGHSHRSRKQTDLKKEARLASLGWTVLRFWNWDIMTWIDTGMTPESSISTTLAQHSIRPTALTVS